MPVAKKRKLDGEEQEAWMRQPGEKKSEAASEKPVAAKPAAAPAAPRTYVVQAGDNLTRIAKKLLGDAGRWKEIFENNRDLIKDPNVIRVGQELKIPES